MHSLGPHVPADLRSAADLPLLRLVHVARQWLQRRALHPVVCEAGVVVPPFLWRWLIPWRTTGQTASADEVDRGCTVMSVLLTLSECVGRRGARGAGRQGGLRIGDGRVAWRTPWIMTICHAAKRDSSMLDQKPARACHMSRAIFMSTHICRRSSRVGQWCRLQTLCSRLSLRSVACQRSPVYICQFGAGRLHGRTQDTL